MACSGTDWDGFLDPPLSARCGPRPVVVGSSTRTAEGCADEGRRSQPQVQKIGGTQPTIPPFDRANMIRITLARGTGPVLIRGLCRSHTMPRLGFCIAGDLVALGRITATHSLLCGLALGFSGAVGVLRALLGSHGTSRSCSPVPTCRAAAPTDRTAWSTPCPARKLKPPTLRCASATTRSISTPARSIGPGWPGPGRRQGQPGPESAQAIWCEHFSFCESPKRAWILPTEP